jgi:hypothetical protein
MAEVHAWKGLKMADQVPHARALRLNAASGYLAVQFTTILPLKPQHLG